MPCPRAGVVRSRSRRTLQDLNRQHAVEVSDSFVPESKDDLVATIIEAGRRGGGLKATGRLYSLSAAAMPEALELATLGRLDKHLSRPWPGAAGRLASDRFRSRAHERGVLDRFIAPELAIERGRALVYVEASIELRLLLSDLATLGLAVATMGSGSNQTLAGAISTATHGADFTVPPLGDFVRALHLIGPGGQDWWLERSRPISRSAHLGSIPGWCADTRVIYDDDIFFSALVSCGRFGVIYAVVLEVLPQYGVFRKIDDLSWSAFRAALQAGLAEGHLGVGGLLNDSRDRQPLRALEAIFDPNGERVRRTRRWLDPATTVATGVTHERGGDVFSTALCHPCKFGVDVAIDTAAGIVAGIGGAKSGIPLAGPFLAAPYLRAAARLHALAMTVRVHRPNASEIIATLFDIFRDARLDELRDLVTDLASSIFDGNSGRDVGETRGLSHEIIDMSEAGSDDACTTVDSAELFFAASDPAILLFLDELVVALLRDRPVEGLFSLRFCGGSSALLAMQQHPINLAVEVAALRPRRRAFVQRAVRRAIELGATVHWGQQVFDLNPSDVRALYGDKISRWRSALRFIEGSGPLSLFSSPWSRQVGLEWQDVHESVRPADPREPETDGPLIAALHLWRGDDTAAYLAEERKRAADGALIAAAHVLRC